MHRNPRFEEEEEEPQPAEREPTPVEEVTRHLVTCLRNHVTGDIFIRRGIRHRAIAIRLVVFTLLLDPPQQRWSLASIAERLGVTRSHLSNVALQFADQLGMRASWMRLQKRDTYAERARRVHSERRKRLTARAPGPSHA